jgi:hypothetical protein
MKNNKLFRLFKDCHPLNPRNYPLCKQIVCMLVDNFRRRDCCDLSGMKDGLGDQAFTLRCLAQRPKYEAASSRKANSAYRSGH